jgi:hypothetical protein
MKGVYKMLDVKKFEKIQGIEVVKRLLDGEHVYSDNTERKFYIEDEKLWMAMGDLAGTVQATFNELVERDYYIKKPFDVRQAMKDEPGIWVAAIKKDNGLWYKIGFDSLNFCAVMVQFDSNATPTRNHVLVVYADNKDLRHCIPIDEVPEDLYEGKVEC